MNREALGAELSEDAVGRNATEVAPSNDLLRRLIRGSADEAKKADDEPLENSC